MKEFAFYVQLQKVRKQQPDLHLAKATAKESRDRLRMAKSILTTQKAKYVLENAYEALRERIEAVLYAEGYKSYSHEASIAYLLELGFSITDATLADQLRRKRHDIKYYGKDATIEEAKDALKLAEKIMREIKKKSIEEFE